MKELMTLLLLCSAASAALHSLKIYAMISSGVPDVPEYVMVLNVEDVTIAYYDSNMNAPETRQDWIKDMTKEDLQLCEEHGHLAMLYQQLFKDATNIFKQESNHSRGVHIIQEFTGCEWDDETEEVNGVKQFGYNGEDFIALDVETETWISSNPQAEITKQIWNGHPNKGFWKNIFTTMYLSWLKMYLKYAKRFVHRKVLPSVSLLQKSPSSPISCHATGFYPHRAVMLWSKDGEEIHEDVDHGAILPNHDGTFQMSVHLDISSVRPADWRRYSCVFQLSGVNDDIITKLDKAVIETNWRKTEIRTDEDTSIPIIVAMVVLVVILTVAVGFAAYKRKKDKNPTSSPANCAELSERLNPETT